MFTYDALQTAEGRFHQLHRTYLPFSVLIETNYEEEAPELCSTLTDVGHELHFTEYVRTRIPLPDQALRLTDGVPLVHVTRVTLTEAVKPLARARPAPSPRTHGEQPPDSRIIDGSTPRRRPVGLRTDPGCISPSPTALTSATRRGKSDSSPSNTSRSVSFFSCPSDE